MSVIFKADGLEAGFTFLIAGSSACAVRPRALPARTAKEDFKTPRRLNSGLPFPDMFTNSSPNYRNSSYSPPIGAILHGRGRLVCVSSTADLCKPGVRIYGQPGERAQNSQDGRGQKGCLPSKVRGN